MNIMQKLDIVAKYWRREKKSLCHLTIFFIKYVHYIVYVYNILIIL